MRYLLSLILMVSMGPAAWSQQRLDTYGVVLPPGALVRMGTLRLGARVTLGVAFSPDGKVLATVNSDFTVRVWEAGSGREVRRFSGFVDAPDRVAFSPDGKILGASSPGGAAFYWERQAGKKIQVASQDAAFPRVHPRGQNRFYSANKKRMASVTGDKMVRVRDSNPEKEPVSSDANLIAFASDRPGGKGSRDIIFTIARPVSFSTCPV